MKEASYYKHVDGGIYSFACEARHSDTHELFVVYEHVWPFTHEIRIRPAPEFYQKFSKISVEKAWFLMDRGKEEAQLAIIKAKADRRKQEGK